MAYPSISIPVVHIGNGNYNGLYRHYLDYIRSLYWPNYDVPYDRNIVSPSTGIRADVPFAFVVVVAVFGKIFVVHFGVVVVL